VFACALLGSAAALAVPPPPPPPAENAPAPPALPREALAGTGTVIRARDPFWPVGWHPPEVSVAAANGSSERLVVQWDDALRRVTVTGISRAVDGTYAAVIKGVGVVQTGDIISIRHGGLNYRWRVRDVTSEGIVPEKLGVLPIK
jgi:hypothetical protein